MATTQGSGRWSRELWVPVLALVALLASGTWLVTQESGSGWGMGSDWNGSGTMSG